MTKVCAHTFVDPNICSKCGWLPPQASQPPPSEFSDEWIDTIINELPDFTKPAVPLEWERVVFRAGVKAGLDCAARLSPGCGNAGTLRVSIRRRAAELEKADGSR